MSAQEAFTGLLLADAGLSAIVGDRVHWMRLPDVVKGQPYVNLQVINDPLFYLAGARVSSYRETFVQADVWAEQYGQAVAGARALLAAVSGYRGTLNGVAFRGVWVTGQRDLDGSLTGGASQLFRRNVDLKISWQTES